RPGAGPGGPRPPPGVVGLAADGAALYAHDGKRVWKSTDDGDTWTRSYRFILGGVVPTVSTVFTAANGAVVLGAFRWSAGDPTGIGPEAIGMPTITAGAEWAEFVRIK
ncbi:MAG: hypothetical protein ACK4F7_03950, partial [Inhella sp.]